MERKEADEAKIWQCRYCLEVFGGGGRASQRMNSHIAARHHAVCQDCGCDDCTCEPLMTAEERAQEEAARGGVKYECEDYVEYRNGIVLTKRPIGVQLVR